MTDHDASKGAPAPWAVKAARATAPQPAAHQPITHQPVTPQPVPPPAAPPTGAAPTAILPAQPATPQYTAPLPRSTAEPARSRRWRAAGWAGLATVLVAAGVVVALVLNGQQDDTSATGTDSPAPGADGGSAPFGAPAPPVDAPAADESATDRGEPAPVERAEPSTPAPPPAPVPPPAPRPAVGDLDLGVPISAPACDGSWLVFLGAATDPAAYPADVRALLSSQPGAMYTLTRGGCTSMRQALPDGSLIYAVYTGPYPDQASACAARDAVGGVAYVKRMDNVTPAAQLYQC